MATDRTNSQKLITLHVDDVLFDAAERVRGGRSRSQWIREAILEKLKREGMNIPTTAALPPDRAGKGGPRPKLVDVPMAKEAEVKTPLPPTTVTKVKSPRRKKL